jgi:hypothetical protein
MRNKSLSMPKHNRTWTNNLARRSKFNEGPGKQRITRQFESGWP